MLTGGAALTALLESYGVDVVFGIPGVHTIELYRGLHASRIRHVTPRHEQGAAFMADGYARASGRPGVCFLISGPGLTNALTAMAQAYADSVPMLVISSVNPAGRAGSGEGWLHELPDQRRLSGGVATFSHTIAALAELPQVMARAFAVFDGSRPRPVHIEIPTDLLAAGAALELPTVTTRATRPVTPAACLEQAAVMLRSARKPLLLLGGGAAGAGASARALAERLHAPAVMTVNARGVLPPEHPLGLSCSPSLPAVRRLIAQADVVFAVGTELGPTDYDIDDRGGMAVPGRLIRLDIDPEQAFRGVPPALALIGDAGGSLAALLPLLPEAPGGWGDAAAAQIKLEVLGDLDASTRSDVACLDLVRATLPDTLLVGDSTRQVYAGNLGFAATGPRLWFNAATGYGALGYGLPAAIGAGLGRSGRPVVCLCGDGGLQFVLGEMATAIEAGVPVILLLMNNRGYGEIKNAMRAAGIAPLGVDLHTPDFQAIATAYGWHAERLGDADDLPARLKAAAERAQPSLIEFDEALRFAA